MVAETTLFGASVLAFTTILLIVVCLAIFIQKPSAGAPHGGLVLAVALACTLGSGYRLAAAVWRDGMSVVDAEYGGSIRSAWRASRAARAAWTSGSRNAQRGPESLGLMSDLGGMAGWLSAGLRGEGWHVPDPASRLIPVGGQTPKSDAEVGEAFRGARASARKTQEHVALEAGVAVRTVRRAETGSRVSDENLRAIAATLNVSLVSAATLEVSAARWTQVAGALRRIAGSGSQKPDYWLTSLVFHLSPIAVVIFMFANFSPFSYAECLSPVCRAEVAVSEISTHLMCDWLTLTFVWIAALSTVATLLTRLGWVSRRLLVALSPALGIPLLVGLSVWSAETQTLERRVAEAAHAQTLADRALSMAIPVGSTKRSWARDMPRARIMEDFAARVEIEASK